MNLAEFETKIGYTFKSKKLLETALTHSSYAREHNMGNYKCNERMEFLGDAYLDAIAGLALFEQMPNELKYKTLILCGTTRCVQPIVTTPWSRPYGSNRLYEEWAVRKATGVAHIP